MNKHGAKAAVLAVFCGLSSIVGVWGQSAPNQRVRGTIERINEADLIIRSRDGESVPVRLAKDFSVLGVVTATAADITPGSFIAATSMPQPDGTLRAIEVRIFPEVHAGIGEGHRPWDLIPQSTMTNATVVDAVDSVDGRVVNLSYKGGAKKLFIQPGASITRFIAGEKSEIAVGAPVFLSAQRQADGSLQASRIAVGRNGAVP